ncbi:ketosynthase chain-length factor [Nocardia arthritidis]|uniref:Ketosynthase chain-length factor n=1 Tax=Nocardia arthritidis TaxID=228602 RepID=A0A6G9YLG8_9NOCA|nr:ketosynthase chain-length factor [Nocardia arthritidis]QIS14054.1 ketosynthase chain-length factor [Nocardia arthritidis]
MRSPVVVTGVGVVAPNGLGSKDFWASTLGKRSGIGRLTRFDPSPYPAQLAGQVLDFDAEEFMPQRLLAQTDISTRFALAAATMALADAGVDPATLRDYDMGVITSNATGGFEFTHREFKKLWTEGPRSVSVYESFAWFYAVNTGQISIRHGLRGPGAVLVGEQAGGLDALGHARRAARRGTPLVVTGGVDSSLDPWGWVSHIASGRLSHADDPLDAYLPFDRDARGYVPGEGGAILVMERADSAHARGVRGYGEIAGYAATFDPKPGSGRVPGLGRAAELALADAGVRPQEVDVVFADAAGVPELDRDEAEAIGALFGSAGVPVTTPKALTGRLYAGGGPLDVVAALLAVRDNVIPAIAGTTKVPDTYPVDVVLGQPLARPVACALVLARGKRGFNSALVIRALADRR